MALTKGLCYVYRFFARTHAHLGGDENDGHRSPPQIIEKHGAPLIAKISVSIVERRRRLGRCGSVQLVARITH